MQEYHWEEFIQNARKHYYEVKSVSCPAFNDERVYFNRDGFWHIVTKHGKFRPRNEQEVRLGLIKDAVMILSSSKSFHKHSIEERTGYMGEKTTAHFWSFHCLKEDRLIIVTVRQFEGKPKHFFSVRQKISLKAHKPPNGGLL